MLLFLNCLHYTDNLIIIKQGVWLILVPLAIFLNLFLLLVLKGGTVVLFNSPEMFLPAIISSWISILIRIEPFQNLFKNKTSDNETYLV
jgi:hypothetical protein